MFSLPIEVWKESCVAQGKLSVKIYLLPQKSYEIPESCGSARRWKAISIFFRTGQIRKSPSQPMYYVYWRELSTYILG